MCVCVCVQTGMVDYVSCSPLRVPVARMHVAAAHAALIQGVISVPAYIPTIAAARL